VPKFVYVELPGFGAARFARLQPWQLHRLQFELKFAHIESVEQMDIRRCARLVQIVSVPTDSAALIYPGGPGLEVILSDCTGDELRGLAAIACTQNEVFGNAKDANRADRREAGDN
jgi:hypothetical protein